MQSITDIIEEVVATEAGYVDNPDDRGGPTIWGITERVARKNGYTGDMRTMPRSWAKAVFACEYVQRPGFDKVHSLNHAIGRELIDTGVNCGPAVAAMFLQRALNALNQKGTLYRDIKVDGDIGPGTLSALDAYLSKRPAEVMLKALNCLQGARYIEICEGREANETFLAGWLAKRVAV